MLLLLGGGPVWGVGRYRVWGLALEQLALNRSVGGSSRAYRVSTLLWWDCSKSSRQQKQQGLVSRTRQGMRRRCGTQGCASIGAPFL